MVKFYRKRYILFKLISEEGDVEEDVVKKAVLNSFQTLFGLAGMGEAGFVLLCYDKQTSMGIIKCNHKFVNSLRASLTFIREINGKKMLAYTVRVSGTLKTLKEFKKRVLEKEGS
ncbi:MAG: Rpp14/Pop5 family protein [Candidatus Bathyarchaeota archaeon]|nr:Rpp14/Pop5 family protein [Candidatus Bathyarchaeota archaeon]